MEIDTASLHPRDAYALLTSAVVPRPIAWVSTMTTSGHVNLAPFSYFNGVGSDPPMLSISFVRRRDGSRKDTPRILHETGVFCVNVVEEAHAIAMNATSAELPPDVSEPVVVGVPLVPCAAIAGMRVASARIALECRHVDTRTYGRKVQVDLVIGEIVHAFVADELVRRDPLRVDADKLRPLSRLGGESYAGVGARFDLPRPR